MKRKKVEMNVGRGEGWGEWREVEGGGWETMRLAYEARVAVRGELASPKSFSRLIHNNKDDRDKRGTPEDTRPRLAQKATTLQDSDNKIVSFLQRKELFLLHYMFNFLCENLVMLSMIKK